MKRFFSALLRAAGFFGIYFGTQLAVTLAATNIVTVVCLFRGGTVESVTDTAMNVVLGLSVPLTALSGLLALLCLAIFCRVRRQSIGQMVPVARCPGAYYGGGALLGVGLCLLTGLALSVLPIPESWMTSYESGVEVLEEGNPVMNFIGTVLVAPVVEETFFRGLLYTRLREGMPKIFAAVLAALVFGAMHGTVLWTIYTFVLGLVFIAMLEYSGSMVPGILAHMAFNLFGQFELAFHPLFILAAGMLCTAAGVLLFLLSRTAAKRGNPYG